MTVESSACLLATRLSSVLSVKCLHLTKSFEPSYIFKGFSSAYFPKQAFMFQFFPRKSKAISAFLTGGLSSWTLLAYRKQKRHPVSTV
jgi:hypothetical protein